MPIVVGPAPAMAPVPSYEVHGDDVSFVEEVADINQFSEELFGKNVDD